MSVEVKQVLEEAGILVLFLPPYSPDKDPLEEAFSYVKYYLKDMMNYYNRYEILLM